MSGPHRLKHNKGRERGGGHLQIKDIIGAVPLLAVCISK